MHYSYIFNWDILLNIFKAFFLLEGKKLIYLEGLEIKPLKEYNIRVESKYMI